MLQLYLAVLFFISFRNTTTCIQAIVEISPLHSFHSCRSRWRVGQCRLFWCYDVNIFAILTFYIIRKTQLWKKLSFCFYPIYLWFERPNLFKKWNIKLNTTATILARTIPFNSIPKKFIEIPLSPVTNTTEVKIKFWLFE